MILTFFDTETTGLDVLNHEIIELACVRVDYFNHKCNIIEQYSAKVKPKYIERASPVALRINGYTDEAWQHALKQDLAITYARDLLDSCDYVVGQNVVFDYRFLNKAFNDEKITKPSWGKYFDTKHMGDQLLSERKVTKSSLEYLCEHYKVSGYGRSHTALVDVMRTIAVFEKITRETDLVPFDFSLPFDPYGDKK